MSVQEDLDQRGYAVVEDAIDETLMRALAEEIQRLLTSEKRPLVPDYFSGFDTIRYFSLLSEGEVWQRLPEHPVALEHAMGVLGHDCLLSLMGTALIGPGARAQPIHCDDDVYGFPRPHPELVLNTVWALNDFRAENGATRVVPGSHRFSAPPGPATEYDSVPLEMGRGSIGLILGTTYHGAGPNTTQRRRDAVLVNFCRASMRQHENLMASVPREKVRSFSPTLRGLLGFRPSSTGVGFSVLPVTPR